MHKLLALVTIPVVASVAFAGPALARPSSAATLTVGTTSGESVATSQPTVGSSLVFGGCGYQPGVGVSVKVVTPSAIAFFGAVAGTDGCFSTGSKTWFTADDAGTYEAASYQSSKRQADAKLTFTVAP